MWFFRDKTPLRFEKREDGAWLTRGGGKDEAMEIPAEYESVPVVGIAENAFYDNTAVRTVVLPDSVKAIGMNAFRGCRNLESVRLPVGLSELGERAFANCPRLAAIEIPAGVTAIPIGAFQKCAGLSKVTLPASVAAIGESAFEGCAALKDIDLSHGVTSIGEYAFRGCADTLCAIFPEKLDEINERNTLGCDRIYARVPEGLMLMHYTGHDKTIALDDECAGLPVVALGPRVFEMFAYLREIRLPKGLRSIGEACFSGCSGLERIDLPEGLVEIGPAAFAVRGLDYRRRSSEMGDGLRELTLPASLVRIGDNAFHGQLNLKRLTFSAPVPQMGSGVFAHTGIEEIALPEGMTEVQSEMFMSCVALRRVQLPRTIEAIWEMAFADCLSLTDIDLPETLEVIGAGAFAGAASLTRLTLPAAVREIGAEAFSYCTGLDSLSLAVSQTHFRLESGLLIENESGRLIAACGALPEKVTVPEGVTEVCDAAFAGQESIVTVTLPATVRRVGRHAFAHMPALQTVVCQGVIDGCGEAPLAHSENAKVMADRDTKALLEEWQ